MMGLVFPVLILAMAVVGTITFLGRIVGVVFMRVKSKCAQPSLPVTTKAVHRSA